MPGASRLNIKHSFTGFSCFRLFTTRQNSSFLITAFMTTLPFIVFQWLKAWCCLVYFFYGLQVSDSKWTPKYIFAVAYAENFHGGVLVQGHMVVIWCALFVTSQFDVIFMFPNQRFGEVCWHKVHIFLHPLSLFYVSNTSTPLILCVIVLNINYQRSKLGCRRKQTQRYDTAVHNCKNIRLRVKTWEQNTLITASEQFTTAKSDCAKVSSNTSSCVLKVCGWRTPWFARSNFAKLHKNWECA